MPEIKPAVTVSGLRKQERTLNVEITTYNLALDRLDTAGIDNPNRSISDKFTHLERIIYQSIYKKLETALENRLAVHRAMFLLEIPTRPAAVDNRN